MAALAALLLVACQPGPVYRPASSPVAAAACAGFAGLVPEATGLEGDATVSDESSERESPEDASEADRADEPAGLTNHQLDGNRVVNGYSDLSTITPIDVELLGVPAWVASVSVGQDETGEDVADPQGVVWGVVLEDGRTQAFLVGGGDVTPVPTQPERLPAGMPPLMEYVDGTARFVIPSGDMSTLTNAVQVGDALIGVEEDGDLLIEEGEETTILDADALPDARVLADDAGQVLFVSSPTERYAHGVLGDGVEAAGITLAEIEPEPRIVRTFEIPEPLVLEGIAPIWADLDGDGDREILATLSDAIERCAGGGVCGGRLRDCGGARRRAGQPLAPPNCGCSLWPAGRAGIGRRVDAAHRRRGRVLCAEGWTARGRGGNAGVHVACLGKPQSGYGGGGKPGGRRSGRFARAQPGSQPTRGNTSR